MKKLAAIAVLTILFANLGACGKGPEMRISQADKEKTKIVVSIAGAVNDNYRIIKKEMTEVGKKENQEIIWLEAQHNVLKQEDDLRKALEEKAKIMIVEPVDPEVLASTLSELQSKDIKMILLGSLPVDFAAEAFVSPDYENAGLLQGNQVIKSLESGGTANVLVLRGKKGNSTADKIMAGNEAVLRQGDTIARLWTEELDPWDAPKAYDIAKRYLEGADKPQAIVAHSAELTNGVIKAVEDTKSAGKVKVFGMGTEMNSLEAMKKGVLSGDIDFMPEMLAGVLMDVAEDLNENEPWSYEVRLQNGTQSVPARFTPLRAITSANLSLLKEREKKLKEGGQENQGSNTPENKDGQGEGNSESTKSNEQKQGNEKNEKNEKKVLVKITTKDGQVFEMNINGEVENIEIKGAGEDQKGQQQGQEEEQQKDQ